MNTTEILLAEVQRLRADYDRQAAEIAAVYVALGADSKTIVRYKASVLVQRLRADLEEQHLTLAAEQGRQEGALAGWHWDITLGCWRRGQWGVNAVLVDRLGDADDGWGWRLPSDHHQNIAPDGIWTARAAMQAADTAQEPR